MSDAGYAQDAISRIFNVQWESGKIIFVYGTLTDNALYYVKIKDADTVPEQGSVVPPGPGEARFGLSANGSSYNVIVRNEGLPNEERTPVFLVCGNRGELVELDEGAHVVLFYTMIYSSSDGLNWTIVRRQDGTLTSDNRTHSANPTALVWDQDKNEFYYDQNYELTDQIFRSADGDTWVMQSEMPTEGDPDYRSAFNTHCQGNDCVDELGQHVPDGVMAKDLLGLMTAKPVQPPIINYSRGTSSIGFASGDPVETWGSDKVEIKQAKLVDGSPVVTKTTVPVPGLKKVFCVAAANGILLAGGSPDLDGTTGAVVWSVDQGKTWKTLADRASAVTTMVAAVVN